jgi:hypothetical protein
MFETVTVDQALARGKRMAGYPVLLIMIIPIAVAVYLYVQFRFNGWITVGVAALSFISAWLYWSVAITKWRLWAFDNVRNVHELKKRAIKEKLIWPDGSFWGKTEIWSGTQKRQWLGLQGKFELDDVFHDDYTVAAETPIHYSKINAGGSALFGLAMLGGGVYFYLEDDKQNLFIGILAVAGVAMLYMGIKHLINRGPQLILSNDGITIADGSFYNWSDITGEETELVKHGKSSTTYFRFSYRRVVQSVEINELDISQANFDKLLRVYRGRSNKKHTGKATLKQAYDA